MTSAPHAKNRAKTTENLKQTGEALSDFPFLLRSDTMNKIILIVAFTVAIVTAVVMIPSETDASDSDVIEIFDEASFVEVMNQNGVDVVLESDLTFDKATVILYDGNPYPNEVDLHGNNIVLDLNGHTITSTNIGLGFAGKNIIIKNGTVNATEESNYKTGFISYPMCIWGEAEVTLQNITTLGGIAAYDDSILTVNNCSIYGTNYYALWSEAHIIVESGDIHKNLSGNANYILGINDEGGDSITVNGGTFTSDSRAGIALSSPFLQPTINGGSFQKDPSTYIGQTMVATLGTDGLYYVSECVIPQSGSIVSDCNSVSADLHNVENIIVNVPLGVLSIYGSSTLDNIRISMESKMFTEAPDAIAGFEINIVTEAGYTADITVDAQIPNGHKALVYYINDSGELVPVTVVGYTASTVTFRTTHTTPFVVMSEEIPVTPSVPDDDELPFIPGNNTPQTSTNSNDDKTTLVAAAAAVVVIMLAVVALMVTRNH